MALNHNWDKGWAQLNQQDFAELSSSSSSDAQVTLYRLNHKVGEWALGLRIFYSPPGDSVCGKVWNKGSSPIFYTRCNIWHSRPLLPPFHHTSLPFDYLVLPTWINFASHTFLLILQVSLWVAPSLPHKRAGWMPLSESTPFHALPYQSLSNFTYHIVIKTVSFLKNMSYSSFDYLLNAWHVIDIKYT